MKLEKNKRERRSSAYGRKTAKLSSWLNGVRSQTYLRKYNLVLPLLLTALILSWHTISISSSEEVHGQALISVENYTLPSPYKDIYPGQEVFISLYLSVKAYVEMGFNLFLIPQGNKGKPIWKDSGNFSGRHEWRIKAPALSWIRISVSAISSPVTVDYHIRISGVPPASLAVAISSLLIGIMSTGVLWFLEKRNQDKSVLAKKIVRGGKQKPLAVLVENISYELKSLEPLTIIVPLLILIVILTNPVTWVNDIIREVKINADKTIATLDQEFFVFYVYILNAFLIFISVGLPLVLFSRLKERFKGKDLHERSYPLSGPMYILSRSIALFLVFWPSFLIFSVANIYLVEPMTLFKPNVPLLILALFLANLVGFGLLVLLAFLDWVFPQIYAQVFILITTIVLVFSRVHHALRYFYQFFGYRLTFSSGRTEEVLPINPQTYVPWKGMVWMTVALLLICIGASIMLLLFSHLLENRIYRAKYLISRVKKKAHQRAIQIFKTLT